MTDAVIFSKADCQYCEKAKALLTKEGITYEEKRYPDMASKDDVYAVMPLSARTSRLLFPQIILGGEYVGGFDDLEDYFFESQTDSAQDCDDECAFSYTFENK